MAKESARITTVPLALTNLRSNHHHLTNLQASRIPQIFSGLPSDNQFSGSVSEPLVSYADSNHHHHQQQQKLRLPLWLDHHANSQVLHHSLNFSTRPISGFNSSGAITNSVPDLVQTMSMDMFMPHQFVNHRYHESSLGGTNMSMLPPHGMKQEQEENKGELSHSGGVSNLYLSNDQNQNQNQNPPHMSIATTMLSTRMNDNAFCSMGNNNIINNNNVVVEVQKLNELVSVEGCTNLGGGSGYLLNETNDNSFMAISNTKNFEHMVMPVDEETTTSSSIMGKQLQNLHSLSSNNKTKLGLTRDFLGVGDSNINIESIRSRPMFQQEFVEFNAMGSDSVMKNLQGQYSGHYC